MNKLNIKFQHCYGIKKLEKEFNFGNRTFSIYAPNGVMKTSFAKTFFDFVNGDETKDLAFPERETIREITSNVEIKPENIFIIKPYNEQYQSDRISTLLANKTLKDEYEKIHKIIDKAKDELLKKLKEQSGIGRYDTIIDAIESIFGDSLFNTIKSNKKIVTETKDALFSEIKYSLIFNNKVIKFLETKDFKDCIQEYIKKFEELIDKSPYLKKEFSFYQAENIQKDLTSNNFFKVGHSVNLFNGTTKEEYSSEQEFKTLLEKEKKKVFEDEELQKKFDEINKKLANAELRAFRDYLLENKELLPELSNIDTFAKKVWISFFVSHKELFLDLNKKYSEGQERIKELLNTAKKEKTSWEEVIKIFNSRFSHLPFHLVVANKEDVILKDDVPTIEFVFTDGEDKKRFSDKNELLQILSTGEKRALYILNIIFEVEIRQKEDNFTLFIIDDIADSFDYKNKYAIIEYLKYMSEEDKFFMFILTHNFDFYRTIQSRGIVPYSQSLIAIKSLNEIKLEKINNLKNPFINDWKNNLNDNKKLIASIPFLRNIIEYTQSENNSDYLLLTSILHYKNNTKNITLSDIKTIFENYIQNTTFPNVNLNTKIIEVIYSTANECLVADEGINLENKIVLSIAIRLKAEEYMKSKITDTQYLTGLENSKNQMWGLLKKYEEEFNNDKVTLEILKRVNLITPENIHVNSFMYEPILDMGDDELRNLYKQVKDINTTRTTEESQ